MERSGWCRRRPLGFDAGAGSGSIAAGNRWHLVVASRAKSSGVLPQARPKLHGKAYVSYKPVGCNCL